MKRIIANQALELEVKTEVLMYAPIDYLKKEVVIMYSCRAKLTIEQFDIEYNTYRLLRSIGWRRPLEMWDCRMFLLTDKPQSARIEKSESISYLCLSESKDIKPEMNLNQYLLKTLSKNKEVKTSTTYSYCFYSIFKLIFYN